MAKVTDMRTCTCGHAPEEHGDDPKYAGSTACAADGCGCISYEADGNDEEYRCVMKPRETLDAAADLVLAYRPKPKSKPAKARKRRAAKLAKKGR
jgi:hypothetical protein